MWGEWKKKGGGGCRLHYTLVQNYALKNVTKAIFFIFPEMWAVRGKIWNVTSQKKKKKSLREEILVISLWILLLFLSMNYFSLHFKILFNREVLFLWQRCEKLRLKMKWFGHPGIPVRQSREKPLLSAVVQEYRHDTSFMYNLIQYRFLYISNSCEAPLWLIQFMSFLTCAFSPPFFISVAFLSRLWLF